MEVPSMHRQDQSPIMSIGEWVITLLLTSIPIVNIVMLFVWGFGSATNPTKANFAKASLIFVLAAVVLWIVFGALFAVMLTSMGTE